MFVNVENIEPIGQIPLLPPSQLAANSFVYRTRVKQAFNSLLWMMNNATISSAVIFNTWLFSSCVLIFLNIKLYADMYGKNCNCKKSFLMTVS